MVASVLRVTAPRILSDLLKWVVDDNYVREFATLPSGIAVDLGTPLGAVSIGAAASVVKASGANTGNGTLVLDPTTPVLANAAPGLYQVRAIAASANAATFRVTDPKGTVLGDTSFNGSGATGAFADRLKFGITDGSTDFVVGDGFDITIAVGSGKIVPLNAAALDGSAKCIGLSLVVRTAPGADTPKGLTYLARGPAMVADVGISWPVGFTSGQMAAALADLAALGIIVRPSF